MVTGEELTRLETRRQVFGVAELQKGFRRVGAKFESVETRVGGDWWRCVRRLGRREEEG